MTVGKKKDDRRERTVGEVVWREKRDGWKRKDGLKKRRTVKRKPVRRVYKNTDVETGVMLIHRSIYVKRHCLRDYKGYWYEKGRSKGGLYERR